MREILFRGKRIDNGEWVSSGNLITFNDEGERKQFFIPKANAKCTSTHDEQDNIIAFPSGVFYKVDPKTLGQYTGLTDKNGKKIFEGDVVKAVIVRDLGGGTQNREETGIIGYDKIGMIGLIAKYAGTIPVWSDFFQELTLSGCIDDFWFEVIGNIHDDPELLEVTADG